MFNKRKLVNITKRIAAAALTAVTAFTGVFCGVSFPQGEAVIEAQAATNVLSGEDRNVIFADSRTDFRDESIYFVMITRYYNGDESNDVQCWDGTQYNLNDPAWRGDFKGLIEKLDYIKALGFTAIWITPVVENCSGYDYHGYHAKDFSEIDERYESDDCTYQDLIDAVHAKDMKIIQDVVFNHTGNFGEDNLMPMFDKVGDLSSPDCLQLSEDTELPANYFDLTPDQQYQARLALMKNTDGVNHDVNNLYHHYGNFNWDDYTCQIAQIAGDCVDLNTENPIVYNYLVDCYTNYINMGVDGFRVDTVRHISRLTFNKVFNEAFKKAGEANGKDFFMFGEVCTRDNGNYWYRQSPSMSTPFYTWKETEDYPWSDTDWEVNYESAIQCTLDNADASTIASQPTSDNAHLNGNNYHTPDYSRFSGLNVIDFPMHWSFKTAKNAFDVAKKGDKYYNDATWNVTYVDSHDYAPDGAPEGERFNQPQDVWAENLSLLFTFRGIPCIYYGSETEFQKGAIIDKGPNIALAESGRAYYGDNIEGTITSVGFGEYGNVSGAVAETLKHPLSQHIQRLNRIRQAIPALRKGQYSTEGVSGGLAFKRRYTDENTDSFVCVSISGNATFTGIPNGKYVDAVTGDVQNVTNGTLNVSVSGKGNLKAYVLDTAKTPAPGRVVTNGKYLTDGGAVQDIGPIEIEVVQPTGITLDKTSVSVLETEKAKVTATVAPTNATYKTVKWTSSNTAVATVAGGNITGVAPGTATITATTTNGLKATVKVTVSVNPNIIKPTGITLSPTTLTITERNTGSITATVAPANATNKSLTWTSSDPSVATVSKSGVVTAVAEGTATITATTFNGHSASVTVKVEAKEVPVLINGVYFEKPSGWGSTIYAYMWDKNDKTQYMGAWPGTPITDLGDNLYGFSYNTENKNMMIIFSDGGSQTKELEFVNNGYYNVSGLVKVVEEDMTGKGKVIVQHVDENGNILSTKTIIGNLGTSYATSAESINGYTLKTTPANASGVYTEADITVTYVYAKDSSGGGTIVPSNSNCVYYENTKDWSNVYIYFWSDSNKSMTSWPGVTMTKTDMTANGHAIYKYEFDENSGVKYVIFNMGSNQSQTKDFEFVKNGYYTFDGYQKTMEVKGNVIVKYVDEDGNEIASSKTLTGTVGNAYTTSAVTVDGYTLKTTPSNAKGTYTEANITVTYVYVKDVAKEPLSASLQVNGSTAAVTQKVGSSIKLDAVATGGSGEYSYKFAVLNVKTGNWFVLQNFGSGSSYTTKLSSAGVKQFVVTVKDSTGATVSTNRITVTAEESQTKLSGSLQINESTAEVTQTVGSSVTIKAVATGGSGSYTYKFAVYNETTKNWFVLKDFSDSSTYTSPLKVAGAKQFAVTIKDSTGATVSTNRIRVVAEESAATLKGTLQVNGSTAAITKPVGSSITLNATATGGSGEYTYKFAVYNEETGQWFVLQNFSENSTYTSGLKVAGGKQFAVTIKDSTGKTVSTNRIYVTVE